MENKLWFKRKTYGWGWTPARWEGWVTVAVFVALAVWNSLDFTSSTMLFWFFARLVALVAVLIFVCYKKGESPRWQWGEK